MRSGVLDYIEGAIRLIRAGPARAMALQAKVAELEFALATALPDGPVEVLLDGRPSQVEGEPWDSLRAEGVSGFRVLPGLLHGELERLLRTVATEPPRHSDRRTELWLADLGHVEVLIAPEARVGPIRGAGPSVIPTWDDDDLRFRRLQGELDWLDHVEAPPPPAPPWPGARRASAAKRDPWQRFVHLALAAQGCGVQPTSAASPLLLGAFDAVLDADDAVAATDLLLAVRASTWAEAGELVDELLRPQRLRRLIRLVPIGLLGEARAADLGTLLHDDDPVVRRAALQLLDRSGSPDTVALLVAAMRQEAFLERPREERERLFGLLRRFPVGRYEELLEWFLDEPRAGEALVQAQVESVALLARDGVFKRLAALRRRGRGWALPRPVRRAIRDALKDADAR